MDITAIRQVEEQYDKRKAANLAEAARLEARLKAEDAAIEDAMDDLAAAAAARDAVAYYLAKAGLTGHAAAMEKIEARIKALSSCFSPAEATAMGEKVIACVEAAEDAAAARLQALAEEMHAVGKDLQEMRDAANQVIKKLEYGAPGGQYRRMRDGQLTDRRGQISEKTGMTPQDVGELIAWANVAGSHFQYFRAAGQYIEPKRGKGHG